MLKVLRFSLAALAVLAALPTLAADGQTPIPFLDPYVTPHVISTPGSYIVTRNLLNAAGAGSIIVVDCPAMTPPPVGSPSAAVTIDLNGMVLDNRGIGSPVISINGDLNLPTTCQVVIRNGELIGGTNGIALTINGGLRKIVIEDVEVKDSTGDGIDLLGFVENVVMRRNSVLNVAGAGIVVSTVGGTIEDNIVRTAVSAGIVVVGGAGLEVSNNRVAEIAGGPPHGAGILMDSCFSCLVSQNTVELLGGVGLPAEGIGLRGSEGCKLYNNLVDLADTEGIHLDPVSNNNLLLSNVVQHSGLDGILIEGSRNHLDRNVSNDNGQTAGAGFGLHIAVGAADNTFGRNTAVGNPGPVAACAAPFPAPVPPCIPTDFCDDNGPPGVANFSITPAGDNNMPPVCLPF